MLDLPVSGWSGIAKRSEVSPSVFCETLFSVSVPIPPNSAAFR